MIQLVNLKKMIKNKKRREILIVSGKNDQNSLFEEKK